MTGDTGLAQARSQRLKIASGLCAVVWLLCSSLSGCVTPPLAVPPPQARPEPPPMVGPAETAARELTCPSCEAQIRELARMQQGVAKRDAELRDLRSHQRKQVGVLRESAQEVTRAKVRLRRLATQADAASYVAEVEVAMESLRASRGAAAAVPLMVLAQDILESTAAPFAQGDYGVTMDRAGQAEQLIALVAHNKARPRSLRVPGEVPLQVAIPLKVTGDSSLRRQPRSKAPLVGTLKKDTRLVAHAYRGRWMLVQAEDGRAGWVSQMRLGAP